MSKYDELQCMKWLHAKVFTRMEVDFSIVPVGTSLHNVVLKEVEASDASKMKLRLVSSFCRDLLGMRGQESSNDEFGRRCLVLVFTMSSEPNFPFAKEADLKKFWLAHIQKTKVDELCALRMATKKAETLIGF